MERIKVLHQVLDPSGIGGVSSEFKALKNSKLSEKYDFQSMILTNPHRLVNIHDIMFYFKKIKEVKPDIVHVRGATLDGLNAVIAAKIYGKSKIFVAVHGKYSDLVFVSRLKRWVSKNIVERLTFMMADGISCVCENITKKEYFDAYRNKMLPFVYNRIPSFNNQQNTQNNTNIRTRYNISHDDIVGLFLGRVTREKGIDDMVCALDKINDEKLKKFVLLIVGDGPDLGILREKLNNKKYKVVFTGSQSVVEPFYHAANFFIMPSLHENHSISLLEACAANLPSVATNCGGNEETIANGITGLIVPVGNPTKLSDAISEMLDYNTRNTFRENLKKEDFYKFSNKSCDNALDSAYQAILEKK